MSVTDITSTSSFEGIIKKASSKQAIAVHWTAKWCGPCKRISPTFDELAKAFPRTKFLRVDVDDNKEVAQKSAVQKLPTFTFYNGSTLLTKETLQGPSASKLKEVVERLDKSCNPFAGGGHRLTGASASSSGGATAAGGAGAADAKPKRFNPWAQKDFVPPGLRAAQEAEKAAKKAKEEEKRKKEQAASRQKTPWVDPNFKPKEAESSAPPPKKPEPSASSSSSPMSDDADDELQKALKMSIEENSGSSPTATAAGADVDGDKMTDDSAAASSSSEGNPPALVKTISQDLLKQLLDMGFGKIRAEKALILTKGKNLQAAMNWLVENESAADIDEPLTVVGSASSSKSSKPPAKVWGKNERGAPLGWKPDASYEDDDLDDDVLANIRKNNKYKLSKKEEGGKPMTKEEKLKDLEERRARRKDDLIKEELAKQKSTAKSRMSSAKEIAELKRKRAEQDHKMLLEKKKREKERDRLRKKKILEKTRLEKERRKREAAERKKRLEDLKAAKAAAGKS